MLLPYRLLAKELNRQGYLKEYLDYERARIKRERNKCRIEFLEQCIRNDIIPTFLKFRVPNNGCFEPTVVHNFQRKLLKGEIKTAKINS